MDFKQEGAANVAAELIDLRAKITERANQVLEAHSWAHGVDKSEIVRKVLDDWAAKDVHVAMMVNRLVRSEGNDREARGI